MEKYKKLSKEDLECKFICEKCDENPHKLAVYKNEDNFPFYVCKDCYELLSKGNK